MAAATLAQTIDSLTTEGVLYEKLPDHRVRCYACGHRCVILDGLRGICKVRYNKDGVLYVPHGYVGALQCDPTEKKPFFHVFPGSNTLTFGMLGCDFHCAYCTDGATLVITSNGPIPIGQLFRQAQVVSELDGDTIATLPGVQVYTHTGQLRPVRGIFRHRYSGQMVRIQPHYLPSIKVTPEHEFLAISRTELSAGGGEPHFILASQLTADHCLAIPKRFSFSKAAVYNAAEILTPLAKPIRYPRTIGPEVLGEVLRLSDRGLSSREIGKILGKNPSHIRHLRSKIRRGVWDIDNLFYKPSQVLVETGRVRFSKEHAPGIPQHIPLDEKLAELLGYYAAEGCVLHKGNRVHAAEVVFALGRHEQALAERIQHLVAYVFGIQGKLLPRQTTLTVSIQKASVALLFEQLCGTGARRKHIPAELFNAPRPVVEAFLKAYVVGDGHNYENGKISLTTVSKSLAIGAAWLALKCGKLPALYQYKQSSYGTILDRKVRQAPYIYTVVWHTDNSIRRHLYEDSQYYYVPIKGLSTYTFSGYVYNLEVEGDHSYLAQFVSTHNCQNYITSQALRDPNAGSEPALITPEQMISLAKRYKARLIGTSYNEPLITAEWAVDIFRRAKEQGFKTCFISNGNGTPEVLEYIRPFTDCYKVDLKSMQEKNYRALGGQLKNVLETIERLIAMGFWVEIVTLVIPGFNDSDAELKQAAEFLAAISRDIPWHVTAFHKDYKMQDPDNTPAATLLRAAQIGRAAGLRFVYAGNLPGMTGNHENTYCPECRTLLIERFGFRIMQNRLQPGGLCPSCAYHLPGIWE